MPFVLQHSQTLQLYTCMLVNHYGLSYYGTKYWDTAEEYHGDSDSLRENGIRDVEACQLVEITAEQLKLCNVKLKNDPTNLLFWENGRAIVKKAE